MMLAKPTTSVVTLMVAICIMETVVATKYPKAVIDKAIQDLNSYGEISARGEQAKTTLTGKIQATVVSFVAPYATPAVIFAIAAAEVSSGLVKESAAAAAKITDMTVKIPLERTMTTTGDHYGFRGTTEVLPDKQGTATNVKTEKVVAVRAEIRTFCLKALKAAAEAAKKLADKQLPNTR